MLGVHWVNCDTYTQRIAHLQGVILQFEAKFNVPVQQRHTVQVTEDEVLEYCAAKIELRDLEAQAGGGTHVLPEKEVHYK